MRSGRRGRARGGAEAAPARQPDYRNLKNPFPPMRAFSDDHIAQMHDAALGVLETQGVKVLLPEARDLFRKAGARVDADTQRLDDHLQRAVDGLLDDAASSDASTSRRDAIAERGGIAALRADAAVLLLAGEAAASRAASASGPERSARALLRAGAPRRAEGVVLGIRRRRDHRLMGRGSRSGGSGGS